MKRTFQTILFLIFTTVQLYAQNWQPVNRYDKYNYQIDTADYITNTVWADSVEVIDGDSVFYLNRIMTDCDTCSNNENNYYALKNQPQFLMRKMIKISDSLYIFTDTSEFVIEPLNHLGETWVFDQVNNISALVSFEGEDMVFGIPDSVKTISLSDGRTIRISKGYGILQYPFRNDIAYNLIGTEGGRELGEQVPDFWDFFDYEVGDVIQRGTYWGENLNTQETIRKFYVISKTISNDTLIYEIEGLNMILDREDAMYTDTSCNLYSSQEIYIDSLNHFTNHYNHELINIKNCFPNNWIYENIYNKLILKRSFSNQISKLIGDTTYSCPPYPYYYQSSLHDDLLENIFGYEGFSSLRYLDFLGLGSFEFFGLTYGREFTYGRIHNGDTVGTIYPDSFFEQYLHTDNLSVTTIRLYPNPAGSELFLDLPEGQPHIVEAVIYDLMGKAVLCQTMSLSNRIDLSGMNTGVYIIEIRNKNNLFRSKFIKQ